MRLIISAIGKMRDGPEAILMRDYNERAKALSRNIGFSGPEIIQSETVKKLSGAQRTDREGQLLLDSAPSGVPLVCLDENGKNMTSAEIAQFLALKRDEGNRTLAFLIGGADGHDKNVRRKSALTLSLGAQTWPHMLVRVMLAEQIYRAMTILAGHPYHRS